jgi:hypothetical protein
MPFRSPLDGATAKHGKIAPQQIQVFIGGAIKDQGCGKTACHPERSEGSFFGGS